MTASNSASSAIDTRPILIIPYMWIGDFVRCHSAVKLLAARWPGRPVDMLSTALCAPLVDYMPGVRRAIVWDLPRKRLALAAHRALAARIATEGYGSALVMPRKWKSALVPSLAGIPERTGFVGEMRFGVINDLRWGERGFPRMVDRCAALALPPGAPLSADWPLPELRVPPLEVARWRRRLSLADATPAVALAPGAVGPAKRWPSAAYAGLAHRLGADGIATWVLGGPEEKQLASEIARGGGPHVRDLTGPDLRNAILALAAANAAIANDSGLLHVAAAVGTPTIGIFGPTSPWHWAPINPLAGVIETRTSLACRPCHQPVCRLVHHRCMRDIPVGQVLEATRRAMAAVGRLAQG